MSDEELQKLEQTIIEEEIQNPKEPITSEGHLFFEAAISKASVRAKGNIIVGDNCEDCDLESELGSVFVLYGSSHDTTITAGKNIYVKHSVKSSLEAGHDIIVENSAMDCTMKAGHAVLTESEAGMIIGGTIEAKTLVKSSNIGNKRHKETIIKVLEQTGKIEANHIHPGCLLTIGEASDEVKNEQKHVSYLANGKVLQAIYLDND